ncbi:type VI secretion system baseplate subunit TssE [Vibrio pectenicida]|uniref:Type VI secretion system baseplate subunit TssE n=1 Tax=Vibrio pectenicida TaxID=62763 RepID=A0A7Y3ZVT2_9VIBR|nr:type VI secretion system baseplate subunit TssE [Vibrio pectenicida]
MGFWKAFIETKGYAQKEEIDDIKYHLIKLFESESPLLNIDDRFIQLQRSNLRFGIEDVQLLSASLDQAQLSIRLESYIRHFEPRLSQVMVELLERNDNENALVFNIIARANTSKGEQELIFDSKISLNDLTTIMMEDSYD